MLVFCLCTSTIEPASRASVQCSILLLSLHRKEEKGKPPSTAIVKYLYLLRFLSFKPVFIIVRTFSMIPRLFPFLKGLWWGIPQSRVKLYQWGYSMCSKRFLKQGFPLQKPCWLFPCVLYVSKWSSQQESILGCVRLRIYIDNIEID